MKILENIKSSFYDERNIELSINQTTLPDGDAGIEFKINKKQSVKFDKAELFNILTIINKIYRSI
jgi:hypothetical protein